MRPQNTDHIGSSSLRASFIVAVLSACSVLGLWLSVQEGVGPWAAGQVLLSLCLVQWFVVLHECGHRTLFGVQRLNLLVGHLAGFLAIFPFTAWRSIHHEHHRWTGWQDKDPTTAVLVPDDLSRPVRVIINVCWAVNIPLFAVIYRVNNYWNLPRLWQLFPRPRRRRQHGLNILGLLAVYAGVVLWVGPVVLLKTIGLAYLFMNIMLDVILLSQHSHIPMRNSGGEPVQAMSFAEQVRFTRSLRFPRWISRLWLLGFDLHELHHELPTTPGYRLEKVYRPLPGEVSWWRWTLKAKTTPADIFLFSNRDKSGLSL